MAASAKLYLYKRNRRYDVNLFLLFYLFHFTCSAGSKICRMDVELIFKAHRCNFKLTSIVILFLIILVIILVFAVFKHFEWIEWFCDNSCRYILYKNFREKRSYQVKHLLYLSLSNFEYPLFAFELNFFQILCEN